MQLSFFALASSEWGIARFTTDSFSLINPDSIISINNVSNTSCFGGNDGNVVINVSSGGNPDYSYSNDNGVTYQSSNIFNNLTAGNYTFSVQVDIPDGESFISSCEYSKKIMLF